MKIAIIGGGITGLSAAYYIKKEVQNSEIILFEKEKRFGGTILTEYSNRFIVEGGPDCFVREKTEAVELAEELGIRSEIIEANLSNRKTFILFKSKLHPLPEGIFLIAPLKFFPFITSSLISLRGKIRMAFEWFIPKGDLEDESVESFVKRRFGVEILERIAEPLVGGIYAGDVRKLSALSCLQVFYILEKRYGSVLRGLWKMKRVNDVSPFLTFRKGMGFLVNTLAETLDKEGVVLKDGCCVISIERVDGGYTVKHDEGEEQFNKVVVATPAYVSANILSTISELKEKLGEIEYISTATISLAFPTSGINVPPGWGVVIPSIENRQIMAITFSSLKFKERVPEGYLLLRCFIGGFKNQSLVGLDEHKMIDLVMREMSELFNVKVMPERVWVYRWFKAMPQYNVGHARRIEEIERLLPDGLFLAGSGYRGVGIHDCIREGRRIAKKLKKGLN